MSRNRLIFAGAAAALLLIGSRIGARPQDPPIITPSDQNDPQSDARLFTSRIFKASNVIAAGVKNHDGEKLGEIKDLVLDPTNGDIAYAVLKFGGILGVGDKLFAIPWSAFRFGDDDDAFVLEVPKERLADAPGFDQGNWPNMADRQWAQDIHEYYGRRPYWEYSRRAWIDGELRNFAGTIVSVEKSGPYHDAGSGLQATMTTDDGPVIVYLAPASYLASREFVLTPDDPVVVSGWKSDHNGERIIVATQVRKGSQILMVRRGDGSPMWNEWDPKTANPDGRKRG